MLASRMLQLKREGEDLAKIREAIVATYDYVKTHFKSEEEFMKSIDYPLLHEQQALHGEIISDMNEIMQQSANIDALVYKFKRLLYGWVTNHILLEDKKIGLFCRNKEKKKALEQSEEADTTVGRKESAPVKEDNQ